MLNSEIPTLQQSTPEKTWRQAVTEFASARNLPVDDVLNGGEFICSGVGFCLRYNAELDPSGMVVVMDMGAIPEDATQAAQLQMLAYNAQRPSALMGYFGLFLRDRRGGYAVRLDLQKVQSPSQAIAEMVEGLMRSSLTSFLDIKNTFHAATGVNPDDLGPKAAAA